MGKLFYKVGGGAARLLSHRMKTIWEVPFEEGPCVFVVNHAGLQGPVDMCTKFPGYEKMHPWIYAEMLDPKKVPAYVRQDYWWKPGSFFQPVLNATVPYLAAAAMPPILRSVDYIPVYRDQRILLTMRESIRALQKDEYVLIFPERHSGWKNRHEWINTGWFRLGSFWYRASGRALKLYPVHVDTEHHEFRVSAPVWYDPGKRFSEQEKDLARKLARGLWEDQ